MPLRFPWVVIGVPLLIIALAITYYFVWFLPQTAEAQALVKDQSDCAQMQQTQLAEYNSQQGISSNDEVSATNHYNPILRKCIVEIQDYSINAGEDYTNSTSYTDTDSSVFLIDAVENATIATCEVDTTTISDINDIVLSKNHGVFCTDSEGNSITLTQFAAIEKQYLQQVRVAAILQSL